MRSHSLLSFCDWPTSPLCFHLSAARRLGSLFWSCGKYSRCPAFGSQGSLLSFQKHALISGSPLIKRLVGNHTGGPQYCRPHQSLVKSVALNSFHTPITQNSNTRAGKMAQWVRTLAAWQRTWFSSQNPHGSSQLPITPVMTVSSDLQGSAHTRCMGKTPIHINLFFFLKGYAEILVCLY